MFSGTDNIIRNIPYSQFEWWNIPQNTVNPIVMNLNNFITTHIGFII